MLACMLATSAIDVVAALVFAVTLVGSYAFCASAAGTAPQNAANGAERGADRRPTATKVKHIHFYPPQFYLLIYYMELLPSTYRGTVEVLAA